MRITRTASSRKSNGRARLRHGVARSAGVGSRVELLDVVDAEPLHEGVVEDLGGAAALPHHVGQAECAGPGEGESRLGAQARPAALRQVGGGVERGQGEHLRRGLAEEPAGGEGRHAGTLAARGAQGVGGEGGDH